MKKSALLRRWIPSRARLTRAALSGFAICPIAAAAQAQELDYTTLNFGESGTFLTGIRGNNIVGNYVIPGTSETGGLLYSLSAGTFVPFPVATENGANYPGAIGSSPYGPSFGSQFGILRTVGSYQTEASAPYDLSYLYDGAAAPGAELTPLAYPDGLGDPTLFTIAHSTFGDQVVGNYDTQLATGNAFIYTISTGTYATNNFPGAISTTAYGVWGDKIAGGYEVPGEVGLGRGFIYDQSTDTWTSYNHPGAIETHFEGITGAGRTDEYNLVVDWVDSSFIPHASVLHIAAGGGLTWTELDVPGTEITSANSIYGGRAIGVYISGGDSNGYVVDIPEIYNPNTNNGTINVTLPNVSAMGGGIGDDIVNNGTLHTSGAVNSSGIVSNTYGVVTNNGTVVTIGAGSAGVEMHGAYGTLLNFGQISAPSGAYAIRTAAGAVGTAAVNLGLIDGQIAFDAGPNTRFENSGVIAINAPGAGTTHSIGGTFVQTSAGILALRVGGANNDLLQVNGAARLAGTEYSVFQPGSLLNTYTILTATDGITGTFDTLATVGLPNFLGATLGYTPNDVTLSLVSAIGQQPGLSPNQAAVGGALDAAFNLDGSLPDGLAGIFDLSLGELPGALSALSGEIHASIPTALIDDSGEVRSAVLDRLRAPEYAGLRGSMTPLGYGGPEIALTGAQAAIETNVLAYDEPPVYGAPASMPATGDLTFWTQGFGGWGDSDSDGNAAEMERKTAGAVVGIDRGFADVGRIGLAAGYSHSEIDVDDRASTADIDTFHAAGYAGAAFGQWKLRTGATFAWNDIETERSIVFAGLSETAKADYHAWAGQVFGEVGYGMASGNVAVEPFGGLAFVHVDTDGFEETGTPGGVAALRVESDTADIGNSSLGVRFSTRMTLGNGMTMIPRGSVAWQHAFGDVTPEATLAFQSTGTAFDISGVPLARDSALVEAGLDFIVKPGMRLGVSYAGQLSGDAQDHAVRGRFIWDF